MSVTPEVAERSLYSADAHPAFEYPEFVLFLAETIQPHHFRALAGLGRFIRALGNG
jgi:hypothetical protein